MKQMINDCIDSIHNYRQSIIFADDDFKRQLKNFESLKLLEGVSGVEELGKKYHEVLAMRETFSKCINEFDDLLYRYQDTVREYINIF